MNTVSSEANIFQRLYLDSFKGLKVEIWFLALAMLINRIGEMVLPFLSLYLTQELSWSKSQAGIALSCFGVGALVGAFAGGWLSDRFDNYIVMVTSLMLGGVGVIFLLMLESYYPFCMLLFISAMLLSAMRPPLFAEVAELSEEENLTRSISLIRMAINLGIAVGPAVGGFLAFAYGYEWLFILDGLTCVLAGVFIYFKFRPKRTMREKVKAAHDQKNPYLDSYFMLFMFFNLIILSVFFQILFSVPVYFKEVYEVGEDKIGWFFTLNGLLICIFEMPIIYVLEKMNLSFKPLVIGAVMIGLSFIVLWVFDDLMLAFIGFLIFCSFGEIINFPYISTISVMRASESNVGSYMGAVSVLFSLSFIVAPLAGLPIIERIGFDYYWLLAFLFSLIGAIGCWWTRSKLKVHAT